MAKSRTRLLNVDIDVKSVAEPEPLIKALGWPVLCQRVGKVGRAHWVRFMLSRQPASPADAILGFAKLVTKLPDDHRAIWEKAQSKEFDIGIESGFEPFSAEWVLERRVIEVIAELGARLRITVYAPDVPGAAGASPKSAPPKNPRRTKTRS
jgi:hypothetical protein